MWNGIVLGWTDERDEGWALKYSPPLMDRRPVTLCSREREMVSISESEYYIPSGSLFFLYSFFCINIWEKREGIFLLILTEKRGHIIWYIWSSSIFGKIWSSCFYPSWFHDHACSGTIEQGTRKRISFLERFFYSLHWCKIIFFYSLLCWKTHVAVLLTFCSSFFFWQTAALTSYHKALSATVLKFGRPVRLAYKPYFFQLTNSIFLSQQIN